MVIGRRPDPTPGDDEGFKREPDPDFAQLPEDWGEWDDEDRAFPRARSHEHLTPEARERYEEMYRYVFRHSARRKDIIGRRADEDEKPILRPKGMLPSPGDEDYCPFADAERQGKSVEELRTYYQMLYAYDPVALKDVNDKIERGPLAGPPT